MAKYQAPELHEQVYTPQHVCVYGITKSGKSTLCAELAMHGYRMHWVSMDNGINPIIDKLPLDPSLKEERFDIINIIEDNETSHCIDTCSKIVRGTEYKVCDDHGVVVCMNCVKASRPFTVVNFNALGPKDIVVFDHGTRLAFSARKKVLGPKKHNDPEYSETFHDWKNQGVLLDEFLYRIQYAKYHVIVITQLIEAEDDDKRKKISPDLGTKNFSIGIGQYFDHVIYCEVDKQAHQFYSGSTSKPYAVVGSRTDFEIEKSKGKLSLLPIFQGKILKTGGSDHYGKSTADRILDKTTTSSRSSIDGSTIVSSKAEETISNSEIGVETTEIGKSNGSFILDDRNTSEKPEQSANADRNVGSSSDSNNSVSNSEILPTVNSPAPIVVSDGAFVPANDVRASALARLAALKNQGKK